MQEYKKPKIYNIILIIGLAIAGVFLILAACCVHEKVIFICLGVSAGMVVLSLLIYFSPNFRRTGAKYARYLQNETKDITTDIYSTRAEIQAGGIKTMAKAVKEGLSSTMFCKHCGAEIEADSKFCKKCGKQQ